MCITYVQMSHLSTKSWRSSLLLKSSSMMQGFNVSVKILLLQTKFCTLINQSYKEHHSVYLSQRENMYWPQFYIGGNTRVYQAE